MAKRKKQKVTEQEKVREEVESGKRVSGEPDSNLAAVGAGGIAGAAAGVAIGTATGGPLGAAIGAAAGAIIGGATADHVQDEWDPKLEEVYWEENYRLRPYFRSGDKFENYLPAYRFGWEAARRHEYGGRNFDQIEPELQRDWENNHSSVGPWETVRHMVKDAFDRIRSRTKTVRVR